MENVSNRFDIWYKGYVWINNANKAPIIIRNIQNGGQNGCQNVKSKYFHLSHLIYERKMYFNGFDI